MKKYLVMLMFALMNILGVVGDNAQSQTTLTGKLTNVTMNGKTYADVENVSFLLVDNGDGTGILMSLSDIGPIGKMPGAISVNMDVAIENGELSVLNANKTAGTLNLKIGGSIDIYASSLSGNAKKFTLDTYALKVLGFSAFDGSVTFVAE